MKGRIDATRALKEPAEALGVTFEPQASKEIYCITKGYPYFLQEWGYQSWNLTISSPITLETARAAIASVIPRLGKNFFRARFGQLTPSEKKFLRGLAEIGPGVHRTGNIADILNLKISARGPLRANLIKKGMVCSPAYGEMASTFPLFDEFMIRAMPTLILP